MSDDEELIKNIKLKGVEVHGMMQQNQFSDAVARALQDPPIGNKNQDVLKANREVVVDCLLGVREDKIKKTIKSLDPECYDLLMKYIYRGLENGKRSSTLFKWHSCLFDLTGIGAVTRVMTDRKTI